MLVPMLRFLKQFHYNKDVGFKRQLTWTGFPLWEVSGMVASSTLSLFGGRQGVGWISLRANLLTVRYGILHAVMS